MSSPCPEGTRFSKTTVNIARKSGLFGEPELRTMEKSTLGGYRIYRSYPLGMSAHEAAVEVLASKQIMEARN